MNEFLVQLMVLATRTAARGAARRRRTARVSATIGRTIWVIGLALVVATAAAAAPMKVALLAADVPVNVADVQSKLMGTGRFSRLDVYDVRTSTPSVATLRAYDSVLVWNNFPFGNADSLGNNLADYVDAGGSVVVAVFANVAVVTLSGRYLSDGYLGICYTGFLPGLAHGPRLTLGAVRNSGSPIMAGITNFDGGDASFRSTGTTCPGSEQVADWSNGAQLVVTTVINGHTTVDLNFFPVSSDVSPDLWQSSTQGALLMANALGFAVSQNGPVSQPEPVPLLAPSTLLLLGILVAGLAATMRPKMT